jgi:acetate---CoA ligase (ADP-forming)
MRYAGGIRKAASGGRGVVSSGLGQAGNQPFNTASNASRSPDRRWANLARLFAPRHLAFVGGGEAAEAIRQCQTFRFPGPIWAVNPKRSDLAGVRCLPDLAELPEAPDAVFLALPATKSVEAVAALAKRGAGGVVCYAAGFKEIGPAGAALERQLIEAAGDMAVVGPNCYGLLNYVQGVALWPFGIAGTRVERGAAILTQSGMFAINLDFSRRSTPLSYLVSCGNQAVLGVEDYLEFLLDDPAVAAVGLHLEGLRDVPRFAEVALKAGERGVPIVALKTGVSALGQQLTVSHTGSLAGSDAAYDALFKRLGVIRVESPAQLMETLKMLIVAGPPKGRRLAAFTCSGGDSEMAADWAERYGLELPQPRAATHHLVKTQLPSFCSVANPLDYNTAIWGHYDKIRKVQSDFLADGYDLAVLIQDHPPQEIDIDRETGLHDTRAFCDAAASFGLPAAVCSSLPENLTADVRALLLEKGVAPLQGIDDGLFALAAAVRYGAWRRALPEAGDLRLARLPTLGRAVVLDEWESKRIVGDAGVDVPQGRLVAPEDAVTAAADLGFPVAVKAVSADLPHKTEAGAVRLGLGDATAVRTAVAEMRAAVARYKPGLIVERLLVERMAPKPVAELMVGLRRDPDFGLLCVLGAGGVEVELERDVATLLLPSSEATILEALNGLRVSRRLAGFRGRPAGDVAAFATMVMALAARMLAPAGDLAEIEINPVFVLPQGQGIVAVDALVSLAKP